MVNFLLDSVNSNSKLIPLFSFVWLKDTAYFLTTRGPHSLGRQCSVLKKTLSSHFSSYHSFHDLDRHFENIIY